MRRQRASIFLALALLCGWACRPVVVRAEPAKPDKTSSVAESATEQAVRALLADIVRTPLRGSLTVGDFLARTGGTDQLIDVLRGAEQIGGPRWCDDNAACQVQLQISGARVAHALQRIANANARLSPISPTQLSLLTRDWGDRSFSATGTARIRAGDTVPVYTAASQTVPTATVPAVKAPVVIESRVWRTIAKADRDQAVAAARLDATQRSLRSLVPVALTPRASVGDVLAVRDVGSGMERWFLARPIARTEFRDDFQAEVYLSVAPEEAFEQFKSLVGQQKTVPVSLDEKDWGKVKSDFATRMAPPVGRGMAVVDPTPLGFTQRPLGLTGRRGGAPEWAERRLDTEAVGRSPNGRNKLQSARAAESVAELKLIQAINDLPYMKDKTIGQAAAENRRVAEAVARAVRHARIGRTEYREDGSARVEMFLDLRDLWAELRNAE